MAANEQVHVFGIRHHGPGSARSLASALALLAPDCVLIEGPPDADEIIPLSASSGMEPPVALLVYHVDNPKNAAFYPFAAFSPEWVAMQHALGADIPVRFIDLPQSVSMAIAAGDENSEASPPPADVADAIHRDPLGALAQAAGHADGERWWDELVESRATAGDDVFAAVAEAMSALRAAASGSEPVRELRREAHMRSCIRDACRSGFERIAVVCGAWHFPALTQYGMRGQASADAALLKSLPKVKTAAAWAPWSYERLATASGYSAGIVSPEWYELVWTHDKGHLAARWLTRVAHLLRAREIDASPASVIEAARLADMLAALRGRGRPTLDDLDQAASSTLCGSDPALMRVIRQKLIVGNRLGRVPDSVPTTPLQADFQRQAKRLRLAVAGEARPLDLDLRNETDLARSRLLHRLALIGVEWGRRQRTRGSRGTFREEWILSWKPDFAVALVEAARFGSTIEEAASGKVTERAAASNTVSQLASLINEAITADLGDAAQELTRTLGERASVATDVFDLMGALPALATIARYGSVRSKDVGMVRQIIRGIVPRITTGLVAACQSLDDDAAAATRGHLVAVDQAIGLLEEDDLKSTWVAALQSLADQSHVHGRVVGRATRLLLDASIIAHEEAGIRLEFALSRAADAAAAGSWIEGLLEESGTLLVHDRGLLDIVDGWITGLKGEHFNDILPLIRRTFATFAAPERRLIGERIRGASGRQSAAVGDGDLFAEARAACVLPVLGLILGGEAS
jgi:hypothetical protein